MTVQADERINPRRLDERLARLDIVSIGDQIATFSGNASAGPERAPFLGRAIFGRSSERRGATVTANPSMNLNA
jgi:hypothetical protein